MAEPKFRPTNLSVKAFIDGIADERKRKDSYTLIDMMRQAAKAEPKMWGGNIVGFGTYHYKYASGHEGDACLAAFSPRKAAISVYLMVGSEERDELLAKLGKHKMGKVCLYINRLDDIHLPTLRKLVQLSVKHAKQVHKQSTAA